LAAGAFDNAFLFQKGYNPMHRGRCKPRFARNLRLGDIRVARNKPQYGFVMITLDPALLCHQDPSFYSVKKLML
jgi:hypothetical protein